MEIIHSKSAVEAQVAPKRAKLPFLEGTKPPVAFHTVEPEDSFLSATIEELTSFVVQKLRPCVRDVFAPGFRPEAYFFILDAKTLLEGSIILVNIVDADYQEDSESDVDGLEDDDVHSRRLRLAGEKVEIPYGKMSLTKPYLFGENGVEDAQEQGEGKFKINAVRVGLAFGAKWAQTIERTSCDVDVLKMKCAKDGVYWQAEFQGAHPPPMKERAGMKELER